MLRGYRIELSYTSFALLFSRWPVLSFVQVFVENCVQKFEESDRKLNWTRLNEFLSLSPLSSPTQTSSTCPQ